MRLAIATGAIANTDTLAEAKADALIHPHHDSHDVARADLIKFFETQTKALLTDSSANVRRAFLGSVSLLCAFFGSAKSNDVILSHLNTYLNDRDWRLKCSFFETIVGVAVYIGGTNLEDFILPLMVQALTDPEETVVSKFLQSLGTMAQLGLFQRTRTWELVNVVARFSMHLNPYIRYGAVYFLSACTRYITIADRECIIKPMLEPFLKFSPRSFSETDVLDALKKPLPQKVVEMATIWATNVEKSVFWKSAQTRNTSQSPQDHLVGAVSVELASTAFAKAQKNEEDQKWLVRLRSTGMGSEDEIKLFAYASWRSFVDSPTSNAPCRKGCSPLRV